jgi:DTW domain-containing protein YfiP
MSAAQKLVTDTILAAVARGPRRCRECYLVINLCQCAEVEQQEADARRFTDPTTETSGEYCARTYGDKR